jgi:dipeptidase E
MTPRLLLLSSSKPARNAEYFVHARQEMQGILAGTSGLLFIPYASPGGISHSAYTEMIGKAFQAQGLSQAVIGIESFADPIEAIRQAKAFFVGGGNTFLLLKTLYEKGLLAEIKARVAQGAPYLGSSAGSNIAGLTINTSNDMTIVHPPSLDALGILPFNINPHFPKAELENHSGETRGDRIREYHALGQQLPPVVAMYEECMLSLQDGALHLIGNPSTEHPGAWLFQQGVDQPQAIACGSDISYLL